MKRIVVLTEDQLKCLSSPVRAEVFDSLRVAENASARELSSQTGLSPQAIHFHLKALEVASLVKVSERRSSIKKPENIFCCTADAFILPDPSSSPQLANIAKKATSATLRRALKGFERHAVDSQSALLLQTTVSLSEPDRAKFNALIEASLQFARDNRNAAAPPTLVTIICHPKLPGEGR